MTVQFALKDLGLKLLIMKEAQNMDIFDNFGVVHEDCSCGTPLVDMTGAAVRALCFPDPPHGVRGRKVLRKCI